MRTSDRVDNLTINIKNMERGLDKLESIISIKNLRYIKILSNNLHNEVGDCNDNLKAIAYKVDPIHTGIVINKHNIIVMTQNGRGI